MSVEIGWMDFECSLNSRMQHLLECAIELGRFWLGFSHKSTLILDFIVVHCLLVVRVYKFAHTSKEQM